MARVSRILDPQKSGGQKLRSTFDKLTPEDFASVAGNKDGLADKVAEKYGISKEEATKQVNEAFSK
ncbi:hypothetical protein PV05_05139 [Exophiala xenobiotica]|uniref:CsbD-like domain-containing protein n=1 Tax=Exophiala xenobiotica TaxID=348802 RepID=A0A0D2EP34_9EURO|nr:uncharacterized protein PV05_05139 [Exophiala xenobiotica]KIW56480.1 hypothetical protein PV05_05139 [Exophiala xenobiotica]